MASSQSTFNSWAVHKPKDPLTLYTWQPNGPLLPKEVDIKMKACGVCRSDVDAVDGVYDFSGIYKYPLVTGHEGVGVVVSVGADVKHVKVGQLVGLGVFRNCCETCRFCTAGQTNLCSSGLMMFTHGNKGCLSDHVRINAKFAFPIPDGISFEHAGPLMCAGTTVFAPFRTFDIKPGQKVGVIGIGGLGHLALQIGRAWGCVVYALSSSPDKEAEARGFGAHHFVVTTDPKAAPAAALAGQLDFILLTSGGMRGVQWDYLLSSLAPNGTLVIMGGATHEPIPLPLWSLIMGQRRVTGSAAGSVGDTQKMLEFCALHNIKPQIETFPADKINDAFAKTRDSKVRYRAVVLF